MTLVRRPRPGQYRSGQVTMRKVSADFAARLRQFNEEAGYVLRRVLRKGTVELHQPAQPAATTPGLNRRAGLTPSERRGLRPAAWSAVEALAAG